MKKRGIHQNSIKAYHEEVPHLSKRQMQIVNLLQSQLIAMTDREIKDALRFYDMNQVRPRVTELLSKRVLVETDQAECLITGKLVRKVKIR